MLEESGSVAEGSRPASGVASPSTVSSLQLSERDGAVRIEVHAKPRAKKSECRGVREGALEVALAAPPVDGAANAELVRFLAQCLSVPQRDVRLLRGEGSRTKLLEIVGLDVTIVRRRLIG